MLNLFKPNPFELNIMKKNILILACIFSSFVILSCNNDDESQQVQPDDHPIVGKWELMSITGGWDTRYFNEGDYVYQFFNDGTMKINIGENVELQDDYSIYGLNFTYTLNDTILSLIGENYPEHSVSTVYSIEGNILKFGYDISSGGNIDTFRRID